MSNSGQQIVVTAIEAISALGATADQTCAAIAAGISSFTEYPLLACTPSDPDWEEPLPLYASLVPTIAPSCLGLERFVRLSLPPLENLLAKARLTRKSLSTTGMLLALPQRDKATLPLNLEREFVPSLCKRSGLRFAHINVCLKGRVGVFSQLSQAIGMLQSGQLQYCIVGGVDTYMCGRRLELLDEEWRLKSARNVDGFIPGEAAAFMLLETEEQAKGRGMEPLAVVAGLGSGVEPVVFGTDASSTGQGICEAVREAWTAGPRRANHAYCDFNGESYYAFELGLMQSRLAQIFSPEKTLIHPADCYGDVGAASGALLMACAINDFAKLGDSASDALLWTTGDRGERSALRLVPVQGASPKIHNLEQGGAACPQR